MGKKREGAGPLRSVVPAEERRVLVLPPEAPADEEPGNPEKGDERRGVPGTAGPSCSLQGFELGLVVVTAVIRSFSASCAMTGAAETDRIASTATSRQAR